MATANPFDLLVDDDNDDPSQLVAKLPAATAAPVTKKSSAFTAKPAAKLPSKPLPPSQAVQEAKAADGQRGGGRNGGGRGNGRGGRGGRGFNRDSAAENENSYKTNNGFNGGGFKPSDDGDVDRSSERRSYGGPRGGYRGGRRGGYTNGDAADGERPKRVFERRSGTGRGNDLKREGAGRGNWGTATDEVAFEPEEPVVEVEKIVESEKPAGPEDGIDTNKENVTVEVEEKEPEEKEMTLEEYEKVLEEKRKALQPLKAEERKVVPDKDLAKMQLLANKKSEEEIFVKLGCEKDKRREAADKEEKAKKSLSINEFLKPAEGEKLYGPGGRGGRGRGRGFRGGYGGGNRMHDVAAPAIEDVGQFPSLGVK